MGSGYEDDSSSTVTNAATLTTNNDLADSGAAYVFQLNSGTWTHSAYLKSPNPKANEGEAGYQDFFANSGFSLSEDGTTMVVGAYGEDSDISTITHSSSFTENSGASDSGAVYIYSR